MSGRQLEHWNKWGLGLIIAGDDDVYLEHASLTDPGAIAVIQAVWCAAAIAPKEASDEPG